MHLIIMSMPMIIYFSKMPDVPLPSFTYTYPFGFDDLTKPTKKTIINIIYLQKNLHVSNKLPTFGSSKPKTGVF